MKDISKKIIACFLFLFVVLFANAQTGFFTDIAARSINPGERRTVVPEKSRSLSLDTLGLLSFFKTLHTEGEVTNYKNEPIIEIPMPDGSTNRFRIWENSIMEPALAVKFPQLKTYTGQGIDDSTAMIKLDWTAFGFHAMILSPITGAVFIDPYVQGDRTEYISYFKSDVTPTSSFTEPELKDDRLIFSLNRPAQTLSGPQCTGPQLLTYRLAVACTGEYAVAATGLSTPTIAQTLSAIMTTVNRVDGVYKTELAIHFVMVANEDHIIFTNPATDPFTGNDDASILINQSQDIIDDSIGDVNYDIGHTFSTGAGGKSFVGVVCQTSFKASSVTGLSDPVGDPFSIDYVAHEIGHEFGAHHPFNSDAGYCGAAGQGSNTTNDEPGSGSTIMAYAEGPIGSGLCGADNLQVHSDPYFNGINFDEITQYAINGSGNTCPVITATGNNAPIANAGAAYTIPLLTPFVLTGSAMDPDGDALTYCWEQVDVGGPFGAWNMPSGSAPIFRSFLPVDSPYRYFPQLSDVINNTTTIGEVLPSYARTMHFRLTARDNRASGGGVCYAETSVNVDGGSGPFKVTYPDAANIKWNAGDTVTITWDPAGTTAAPVNCSNVNVFLSIDGGQTYPYILLTNTPNIGSVRIPVPAIVATQARIKIMSAGNIFYDISNNNFTIEVIPTWSAFPNPATNEINLRSNIDHDNVEIEMFTITGQLIYKTSVSTTSANAITTIPTQQFPRGVYILKIQSNSGVKTQKIILR
jgi:Metallo-peptidase family M12B Reprolysin-like/Secretion system C-terminal sorting domain